MNKAIKLFVALLLLTAANTENLFSTCFNKAKMDSLFAVIALNNKAMMSISVAQNGVPLYNNAIGYSLLTDSRKIPATTQTRYRIGSISKMFTAVMIFQLIEEGKLKLTTPLATYFPDVPNAGKITIANMLN